MKVVIFDDEYPDSTNLPGDMFVHTRARHYILHSHDVLILRHKTSSRRLDYEGVAIQDYDTVQQALDIVSKFAPDAAAVHFAGEPFISGISVHLRCPLYVWVHGYEALAWHRRMFTMTWKDFYPHRLAFRNRRSRERLNSFAKLIDRSNAGAQIVFVFVSNWMKRICEADTRRRISNFQIIPNPIDTKRLQQVSLAGKERNILVIRSSNTMKYSPDIIAGTLRILMDQSSKNCFKCRIFSDGELFDKYFAPLANLSGVELNKTYLSQQEIVEQHQWAGIFLCPTRQDAQGVSMCEAMSSGLVVATNPITAIPEFTSPEFAILSHSARQLARDIDLVTANPKKMAEMGKAASAYVSNYLSATFICDRELRLFSGQRDV